jgi:hypothetical protein
MDVALSRQVNTTTNRFLREEEVNILRNRKLTALVQQKGRIKYNQSGNKLEWRVRYKRVPIQGYADADTLTFPRRDRWKVASLPWRGYVVTDSEGKIESLANRGPEAIIKVYGEVGQNLRDDIEDQFGEEMYLDGNLAANAKRMHGLESFFGCTAASGAKVAVPNDSYAGLSTVLGDGGGAWSGTWPDGRGDSNYDYWSPIVIQYAQDVWGNSGATWALNCLSALRFGLRTAQRNKSKRGMVDLVLLSGSMYEQFLNKFDNKQEIIVNRGDRKTGLVSLGFGDTTYFDGAEVTWEYGIPDGVGYGINVDEIELNSMQGQLFQADGPDWDIASRAWRFAVDFLGNMRMNPRNFFKLAPL